IGTSVRVGGGRFPSPIPCVMARSSHRAPPLPPAPGRPLIKPLHSRQHITHQSRDMMIAGKGTLSYRYTHPDRHRETERERHMHTHICSVLTWSGVELGRELQSCGGGEVLLEHRHHQGT